MMENVIDIARWFLSKESMTHKKLQKLCYYSQAWYCALYDGSPLFPDNIEAWVHGPVIPSLYAEYADFKWNPIPKYEDESYIQDENAVAVLDAVYNTYGGFNGDELESLTHSEDPWILARGDKKPWETCTSSISYSSMRKYYGEQYQKSQND